jgi:RimJ/RimL family protein N-acetyltransferase
VGTGERLLFGTNRLLLREVDSGDLRDMHRVFASNPDFLQLREEMAPYDLESVTRYWEAATLGPGRHVLVAVHKDTGIVIGVLDFVDRSPADGMPWIGLVMIHRDHQRRGFGTEAVQAVAGFVGSQGHRGVRMAVIEDDETGSAFARHVGFEAYGHADPSAGGADRRVALMELSAHPHTAV